MTEKKTDWQGGFVPPDEPPEKEILVWVITSTIGGADEAWVREYTRAVAYANEVMYQHVDNAEESDLLEHGVTVTMKLRRATVLEYQEACENEV